MVSHSPDAEVYAKCFGLGAARPCELYGPSLIELIVRPEWYDGARVRVIGVLSCDHDDSGLSASMDEYRMVRPESAVGLDSTLRACDSMHGQWVDVIGRYRPTKLGHRGRFAGTLEGVESIMKYNFSRDMLHPPPPVRAPEAGKK